MRVKAVLQLYLKDRPQGFLGPTGETWVFGDKEELSLFYLLSETLFRSAPFFGTYQTDEELNEQLDKLREWLFGVKFLPYKKDGVEAKE